MNLEFDAAPVTHYEYIKLRLYGMTMYSYRNAAGIFLPKQCNPLINVKALVDFYTQHGDGKSGIRFYPGFNGQKLILLMCLDNENTNEHTDNWSMLDQGFYLEPDAELVNISREEANAIHNAYLSQILIAGNPHTPSPTTDYPDSIPGMNSWNTSMLTFKVEILMSISYT